MNTFGRVFRITLFGESHGPGIGVVLDGCPPAIALAPEDFRDSLARRRPGALGTTARRESDEVRILSGVFRGRTTGAPLTLWVPNLDLRTEDYPEEAPPRPGHADRTLEEKWGGFHDPRGGGTASGRLTVGLVLAGVVARKILPGLRIEARVTEVGGRTDIEEAVAEAAAARDSVGGIVECLVEGLPAGLGEPWFDPVESVMAHLLHAIPAVKGVEFGSGFRCARMRGSEHNDPYGEPDGRLLTNHAGGVLGGITTGAPLRIRVAVKPAASIGLPQRTWDFRRHRMVTLQIRGRHDACIALRMPVIVEAAVAVALADLVLVRETQRIRTDRTEDVRERTQECPSPDVSGLTTVPPAEGSDASTAEPDGTSIAGPLPEESFGAGPMEQPLEPDRSIEDLRERIDRLNHRILEDLSERGRLVQEMRRLKDRWNLPMHSPGREREMMEDLVAHNRGPFRDEVVRHLFREIFRASLDLMEDSRQEGLRVARRPGQGDRVIQAGSPGNYAWIGAAPVIVAGPCSVEDPEQIEMVASHLVTLGIRFLRGGAFKPRTSPYDFQGLGEEGLRLLAEAGRRYGLRTVSEVVDTRHVDLAARYVDVLQIGSRNMSNYELLKAAASTGRPVLLKRGFAATLDEFLHAAEYLAQAGNDQVILCERGIRSFARETRFTLDISAVPLLRQMTPLPVLVDVSHAAGRRDILLPLARAALAAGAQGIMVEVHPAPHLARSDAQQQMDLEEFQVFLAGLRDLLPTGTAPEDRR